VRAQVTVARRGRPRKPLAEPATRNAATEIKGWRVERPDVANTEDLPRLGQLGSVLAVLAFGLNADNVTKLPRSAPLVGMVLRDHGSRASLTLEILVY
jgi:hypothetical protein